MRAALHLPADPAIEAYVRSGRDGDGFFILQIHERVLDEDGPGSGETRHSCQIIYTGPERADSIYESLADFFWCRGI